MSDILLTETYELDIQYGDFAFDFTEGQHIQLLFDTSKGDWTQNPLTGIGLVKWRKGRLDARFEREVQLQLEADGMKDLRIDIQNEQIFISKK